MRNSSNALLAVCGVVTILLSARLAWDVMRPRPAAAPFAVPVPDGAMPSNAVAIVETPAATPHDEPVSPTVVATPSLLVDVPAAKEPKRRTPPTVAIAEPVVPLDVARAALEVVGDDPAAGEVWVAAINDPSLSPRDRSDLIEDLNENGFADPDHVTPDELPLVLARLDLIERLAPDAMDDVNAAAFAEAYKDLSNIADRLTR